MYHYLAVTLHLSRNTASNSLGGVKDDGGIVTCTVHVSYISPQNLLVLTLFIETNGVRATREGAIKNVHYGDSKCNRYVEMGNC